METVQLTVKVDKSELQTLKADIKELKSTKIKIGVDASGFNQLNKATLSAMKSVTGFVNATTRAQKQESALAVAREKTKQVTQKRITAEKNLAKQISATEAAQTRATAQVEKTRTEQARAVTQMERTRTAQQKYATEVQRTTTEYARAATQAEKTRTAQAKATQGTQRAARSAGILGDSIGNVALKMAAWQVMGDVVSVPIRAFKEALSTMQAVDDQLVDVRKVTDFTKEQMAGLEQQAYKTASAYGVAADEYLSSVASFARAGYKEQSSALAELSTKTQIVGDTSQEVANQFLLSVDAAYKYNGSIEKLSRVLDGANEIDNKYATSISNIAEGMGKVAPIAAQAHTGVDELMAGIGTITAVTQRSGTEAATALRALFLNILGDTKTEISDGATWTAGEINGLRDVLNLYAHDVVAAADATGSVIDPMEAIGALAQSMKDGVLTEQKLMEMVSDIGGKLRSSQLLALIQNWDMYESMLTDYGNAMGSADREVANAMDSWSRKLAVMKNSWTEFVQGLVSTDMVKGAFDRVTGLLDVLNTDVGHAAVEVTALSVAFAGIEKGAKFLAATPIIAGIKSIATEFAAFASLAAEGGVMAALSASFAALPAAINPVTVAIAALLACGILVPKVVEAMTTSYAEQTEKVDELQSKYDQLTDKEGELATLRDKVASGTASGWEKNRFRNLEQEKHELEEILKLEKERQQQKFDDEYGKGKHETEGGYYREDGQQHTRTTKTEDVAQLDKLNDGYNKLIEGFKEGKYSASELREEMTNLTDGFQEYYDVLKSAEEAGVELSPEMKQFMSLLEEMQNKFSGVSDDWMLAKAAIDDFNGSLEMTGKNGAVFDVMNMDALRAQLESWGVSASQIDEIIANINNNPAIVKIEKDGDPAEIASELEKVGLAVQESDGWHVNVDGMQELLSNVGVADTDISNMILKMGQMDGITLENSKGEVADLKEYIGELSQVMDKDGNLNFDNMISAENAIQQVGTLEEKMTGAKGAADALSGTTADVNVTASGAEEAQSKVEGTKNAVDALDGTSAQPKVSVQGTEESKSKAESANQAIKNVGRTNPKPTIRLIGAEDARGLANGVSAALNAIPRFVQSTIRVVKEQVGGIGGAVPGGTASLYGGLKAKGTSYAKGGPTLLGDEYSASGTPKPELVIAKGQAYIAGVNGPEIRKIPQGAQVFTYDETKRILGRSDPAKGIFQAFGSGTPMGGGKSDWDYIMNGAGSKQSGATSSSNKGSSSGKSNKSTSSSSKTNKSTSSSKSTKSNKSTKSSSKSSSSSSSGSDDPAEAEKKNLELLKSQYNFLEETGADPDQLIAKSKEIQAALNAINNKLRATGGEEKDIVDYSTQWWKELKTIQETQRKVYENQRDLLNSEIDLMEKQGYQYEDRISKLKEIQNSLHDEADYLRSIKADQKEINELSIEWWKANEEIKKLQKELWDELSDAISDELKKLQKARDKEVKAIDEYIEKRKKEREETQKTTELEEKRLAVEKAHLALVNATNERTVRTYNAATGQWEWVADESKVKSSRESYESAKEELEKYEEEQAFNAEIEALERRKTAINDAYDQLEEQWETINESVQEPSRDIATILADIAQNGTPAMKEAVDTTGNLLKQFNNYLTGAIQSETGDSFVGGGGTPNKDYSSDTTDYHKLMSQASDEAAFQYWAEQRTNKIKSQGIDTSANGWKSNEEIYNEWKSNRYSSSSSGSSSSGSGGSGSAKGGYGTTVKVQSNGKAPSGLAVGTTVETAGGNYQITKVKADGSYESKKVSDKTYDSGGILHGMGGIKATMQNEMVLPPSITGRMLKPSANATFQARMAELGYLYGGIKSADGKILGAGNSRSSQDHYGDTYQFGDVRLSEDQAKGTTVYELAQKARNLGIYGWN